MRDEFDKINDKLDHVVEEIVQINQTLIEQHGSLKLHMARTEVSEKRLDIAEEVLKPLIAHVNKVQGALQMIGMIASTVTLVVGIIKIIEFLKLF